MILQERHENEQYFFTNEFENWYVNSIIEQFGDKSICCVCCPMIGKRLADAGVAVTILDIDTRFASYPQFKYFDITNPSYIETQFDLIVCDPPFFNVSFNVLLNALKSLSHYDTSTAIMITYLYRREEKFLHKLSEFNLHRISKQPTYKTVDVSDPKRDIRLYSNHIWEK